MSYIKDYGLDLPSRALPLLALSFEDKNKKKTMDILHIQKVIRYFEHLTNKKRIDYSNFKLGGVSYELTENIDMLLESGLIEKVGNEYTLTDEGERAAKELSSTYSQEELNKLKFSKCRLNHLDSDELMFFMYCILPETKEHSTEISRLEKKREKLIRNLIIKGAIDIDNFKSFGINEKEFFETIAVMRDPELTASIHEGERDILKGKVRPFSKLLEKYNCI